MKNLTNYVDIFLYLFALFMTININLDGFHEISYYSTCTSVYVSYFLFTGMNL